MANQVNELRRKLLRAGAQKVKDGSKHDIYLLGTTTIPVPHGSKLDWRWVKDVEKAIRNHQKTKEASHEVR